MDAKKRLLRTTILLLPVLGIALAVKNHPTGAPTLRRDVAFRNNTLDFTGAFEPAPVLPKRRPHHGNAERIASQDRSRQTGNPGGLPADQAASRSSLRPDLTWTQGMFVLGTRTQAVSGW